MARSNFYIEANKVGKLCVRSHRDPSWFCDPTLFLSDKYGAYSDAAKSAVRKALSTATA